jgi:hypothetical protein
LWYHFACILNLHFFLSGTLQEPPSEEEEEEEREWFKKPYEVS